MPDFLKKWVASLSREQLTELTKWFDPAVSRDIDFVNHINAELEVSASIFNPEDSAPNRND